MDNMLLRMANDLGVTKYIKETENQYCSRLIYSAMASWIKAMTLDHPSNSIELTGVGRKYILDRSNLILTEIIKRNPDQDEFFKTEDKDASAISLLRERLIRNGDINNYGYDTKLLLSKKKNVILNDSISCVKGYVLKEGYQYSGIAMLELKENLNNENSETSETILKWMREYETDAWWRTVGILDSKMQFFNAHKNTYTNYECWQDVFPKTNDEIVLARKSINKNDYEYILLRDDEGFQYHRIDPVLHERGEHIRMMLALRKRADNPTVVSVNTYIDHVILHMYVKMPNKEEQLLETYTWPMNNISNIYRWSMSIQVWQYIKQFIVDLGIKIMEEKNG